MLTTAARLGAKVTAVVAQVCVGGRVAALSKLIIQSAALVSAILRGHGA